MTTATKAKSTLIESATLEGAYGMLYTRAIVDHPKHGRLIIEEGFGGMDGLEGGAYRWRHGCVYSARPDTTLADTIGVRVTAKGQHYFAMEDFDALEWPGMYVARLAESLGL